MYKYKYLSMNNIILKTYPINLIQANLIVLIIKKEKEKENSLILLRH